MPRVLVRQLDKLGARSALRHMPGNITRQSLERGEIVWHERQQHPVGALFEGQVEPHQECAQDGAIALVLDVLEKPMVPRDQPAVADAENHAAGVVSVAREPDRVGMAPAHDLHRLGPLDLVYPLQRIPQLGRPLEIEVPGGILHPVAQPRPHIHRLPFEKDQHVLDHPAVLFPRLVSDARGLAPIDVVVEARPIRGVDGEIPRTGTNGENAPDDLQRLAQSRHVGVGTEIPRSGDV